MSLTPQDRAQLAQDFLQVDLRIGLLELAIANFLHNAHPESIQGLIQTLERQKGTWVTAGAPNITKDLIAALKMAVPQRAADQ